MYSRHRTYLLIAFLLASASLAWIAGQEGNHVPICLFGSWGIVLGTIIQMALMSLFTALGLGIGPLWLAFIVSFSSYLLYLLGLMKLNSRLSHRIRFPFPIIPLTIHTAGSLLCLPVMTSGKEFDPFPWLPAVIVIVYLLLDWQLALRGKGAGGSRVSGIDQPQVK